LFFNQYVNPIALEKLGWKYYIVRQPNKVLGCSLPVLACEIRSTMLSSSVLSSASTSSTRKPKVCTPTERSLPVLTTRSRKGLLLEEITEIFDGVDATVHGSTIAAGHIVDADRDSKNDDKLDETEKVEHAAHVEYR
jgi:hypothetical protein